MTADRKDKHFRIPIKFMDADPESENEVLSADNEEDVPLDELLADAEDSESETFGGPDTAELIATRSELKRVEGENADLKNQLARRQADFENYRKRVDRERNETYNRVVADIATKLLPVSDNLKRALEAESSVEAAESDEFRHFLSGVDLIWKQLNGLLETLGVKQIPAVGEPFDPHVHEAVVTEATDEYEPDTVIQEIVAGYRLGDKLIRPALVKVATRK
jgi:molecular chaperone GrpE